MSFTIQFSGVSKKYHLGMTRTSLPTLISTLAKSAFNQKKEEDSTPRNLWAVRDISFELKKGDTLALIGPNGAGKTTILKLLAQITKPTLGEIKLNGKMSALIELGAGFHPDLTGRENIYLNGAILGLKKQEIQRRFDSIVAFSELARFIDTPVKRYSSGMAVRLGFAIAASIDPDILLVDEVLAVGDSSFRLRCTNRIHELIENDTTLIFVSHNLGLVKAVCEKALYIDKGQAKYFGRTNEVIEVYNRDLNEQRINEFQIPNQDPETHSTTVEITKLIVTGIGFEYKDVIKTNQPAKITIQYHAWYDIGDVSVVLRIIRSDGVDCCVMYSKIDQFPIHISRGRGTITTTLNPLQLFPGIYYIVATLKDKNETLTYDMEYSDWFRVESDLIGNEDLDAVYEPNRVWDYQL